MGKISNRYKIEKISASKINQKNFNFVSYFHPTKINNAYPKKMFKSNPMENYRQVVKFADVIKSKKKNP